MATSKLPAIVEQFCTTFDIAPSDSTIDANGRVYGGPRDAVGLCEEGVTQFGVVDFTDHIDAQYDRTETFEFDDGSTRAYVFTHEYGETAINVKYLRQLANDVFDCSYDVMKANAHVFPPRAMDSFEQSYSPIWFTPPNHEYTAVVGPLLTDE